MNHHRDLGKFLRLPPLAIAAAALLGIATNANAVTVTLTTSDSPGSSSFNAAGGWNVAGAPISGNDYVAGASLLRTPTTSGYTGTFAGDSLTINSTAQGLIFKSAGTSNTTINNLILDNGWLRDGVGTTDHINLLGSMQVTANGGQINQQTDWNVQSNISGTGDLNKLTSNQSLTFSGTNTWTGNLKLAVNNTATNFFTLASTGTMTFGINAGGLNNKIMIASGASGGIALNGTFNFDLSGAGLTLGDSWTIIGSGLTATYGGSFSVANFTQSANLWTSTNGSYQFNTSTGVLTVVPEPQTVAFGICGLLGVVVLIRRRHTRTA